MNGPPIGRHLLPTFIVGPDLSRVAVLAQALRRCDGVIGFGRPLEVFSEMPGLLDLVASSQTLYSPTRQDEAKRQVLRRWQQVVDPVVGPPMGPDRLREDARSAMQTYVNALPSGRWSARDVREVHDATTRFLHALAWGHARWTLGSHVFLDEAPFGLLTSGTLLRILPQARFIHVIREPVELIGSLASNVWGPIAIDSATKWCVEYAQAAKEAADLLPPGRVLEVKWEDLARGTGHDDLAAFLDLDPAVISTLQVQSEAVADGGSPNSPSWLWMASPTALRGLATLQQVWRYPRINTTLRSGRSAWPPSRPVGDREHHTAS